MQIDESRPACSANAVCIAAMVDEIGSELPYVRESESLCHHLNLAFQIFYLRAVVANAFSCTSPFVCAERISVGERLMK